LLGFSLHVREQLRRDAARVRHAADFLADAHAHLGDDRIV
jgi:hypothetical protein